MAKQTLKDILSQLKADLIGKDSYRGVTLSYSWLANLLGAFSAGYMFEPSAVPLWANLLLAILLIVFPGRDWYLTKIYQQKAIYPFQFRLSQWNFFMEPVQANLVKDYLKTAVKNKTHLLLFGAKTKAKVVWGLVLPMNCLFNTLDLGESISTKTISRKLGTNDSRSIGG